jgi:hypothetical protein
MATYRLDGADTGRPVEEDLDAIVTHYASLDPARPFSTQTNGFHRRPEEPGLRSASTSLQPVRGPRR